MEDVIFPTILLAPRLGFYRFVNFPIRSSFVPVRLSVFSDRLIKALGFHSLVVRSVPVDRSAINSVGLPEDD